ncbi:1,2-phenylacetyl-CoA epoxidase subunit B [Evansella sp. LMS18]|jgi:ring-1,2-phenylacetyl-CoA epoxidase subunit PaaB|uniref:1,2-phenylacetyl-CoA epoxidase subunit PaaB n=1 Tax=Evansella sp. LMS18 TaxID=2924033 RepID=UPI0020D0E51A|nr:1,2-phenylacetyl-CoA epoxidase subunit PaaB [Evansella sp. LMS18]UTR09077.1 1,2-phenylacetyl-CoA epoxidase subunit B [Evansella sp. LMS18]
MDTNRENIDLFYEEFVVFSKKNPNGHMTEQYTLLAPNAELALMMAQENFMRREPVSDLWVVKRSDITAVKPEDREMLFRLDNKDYRNTKGYGYLKKKWREKEQEMFDEKEILSWAKGVGK